MRINRGLSCVLMLCGTLLLCATSHASVDVRTFGAVGNGQVNEAPAFQRALDTVPAGETLFIPAGRYRLDQALRLQRSVSLAGTGPASVLFHTKDLGSDGGSNLLRIGGATSDTSDVVVQDLAFAGPPQSALRTVMIRIVSRTKNVRVTGVTFQDVSSSCVLVVGEAIRDIVITKNIAREFYEQFVELGSGVAGLTVTDNDIVSSRGHPKLGATEPCGFVFEVSVSGTVTQLVIARNHVSFMGMSTTERNNSLGISLSTGRSGMTFLVSGAVIEGNTIEGASVGVRVQRLRTGSVSGPGSVTVTNNIVRDARKEGIAVSPASDTTWPDTATIVTNVVERYSLQAYGSYDGIHVDGKGETVAIQGNQLRGSKTGRYGIFVGPGITDAEIANNTVSGYKVGDIHDES
jgi:hypothetical protein